MEAWLGSWPQTGQNGAKENLSMEKKHLPSVLNRTCLVFITQITCATHPDIFAFRNCTFKPQSVHCPCS